MHDHDDDEFDEAEYRREEYERLFGTPEERAAEAREMAERRRQIDRDETLAWCAQRVAAREFVPRVQTGPTDGAGRPLNDPAYRLPDVVMKDYGVPAAAVPHSKAQPDWTKVIGTLLAEQELSFKAQLEAAVAPFARRVTELEAEVRELQVAALRRAEPATDAEARKRAGDIRRTQQEIAKLRAA